jgi:hypothetical protein
LVDLARDRAFAGAALSSIAGYRRLDIGNQMDVEAALSAAFLGCTRHACPALITEILVIDSVNVCAGTLAPLLPGFGVFEFHADGELALLRWIGRQ